MARSGDTDSSKAAVAEVLWGGRPGPRRGPRPGTDPRAVARAAVRVADADGMSAVSMQRVAAELGLTKMALYRYVSGKAELVAVMIEAAVGDPPDLTQVPGGWRLRLIAFAEALGAAWARHPWLPWATMGDRPMGPNEVSWIESAVAALADTGLDGTEQMDTVFLLCGHVRNTLSLAHVGTQPWSVDRQLDPSLRTLVEAHADRYPALTAAVASASGAPYDNGREFGLLRILDGVEALVVARGG